MSTWLVIAEMAAVTFLLRGSFILFANPHKFPHAFRQALQLVPAAVLAAIVAPGIAAPGGVVDLSPENLRLLAGLIALAAAARIRHPLAPIAAGMGALWLLQVWIG
ncbi:MAG TPA: AzlD domain-containing protein [Usitatibacter sp.]|jgi:branched-subunit amino acid transport protein|nr:AzlD domain-containing protein [Usitatibacter sp.]